MVHIGSYRGSSSNSGWQWLGDLDLPLVILNLPAAVLGEALFVAWWSVNVPMYVCTCICGELCPCK